MAAFTSSMTSTMLETVKEMIREQFEFRELLYQMTKRDLLLRYKQTVMGFGWAVFMPLLNTFIFTVIFTQVAKVDTGVPYPIFAYSGLWAWNFFAASLKFAAGSLTSNTNLVTKVYFPRELFPISAVAVSFVDFMVGGLLLIGLMIYYHISVGPALLALPLIIAVQVVFTLAIAMLLAMANLFYRDVKYLFEVVISVWMFGSAVVYPADRIGGKIGFLIQVNPMTSIIESYRHVLLYATWPPLATLGYVAGLSIVFLLLVWVTFHRAEARFAESV